MPFRSVWLICLECTGQKTDHNQAGYRKPAPPVLRPFPQGPPVTGPRHSSHLFGWFRWHRNCPSLGGDDHTTQRRRIAAAIFRPFILLHRSQLFVGVLHRSSSFRIHGVSRPPAAISVRFSPSILATWSRSSLIELPLALIGDCLYRRILMDQENFSLFSYTL